MELTADPTRRAAVGEVRAIAREIAADAALAGDEELGPDEAARQRLRAFIRRSLGEERAWARRAARAGNLRRVPARVALAALAAAVVLGGAGSAAALEGPQASASARAIGVRVVLPGGGGGSAVSISAPPAASRSSAGYSYAGGAVAAGSIAATARATSAQAATSGTRVTVQGVSLFGGEIVVDSVSVEANARASAQGARGSLAASELTGVTILGASVSARPNARVPLGDWGYAVLLEQAVVREREISFGYRGFVTGLHVRLTAEHGGLPAGTDIMIGYAEAAASAEKAKTTPPAPPPAPPPAAPPPARPSPPPPASRPSPSREPAPAPPGARREPPPVVQKPPASVKPSLTARGYVFPVYGPASFTDDFGAARAATGWHHGIDIFAPLGAPVLAVADGTVFRVGWNTIGGNRLWLRDGQGNEFYYAHLSAFSPLAFDGARVRAGDVIGFVGDTGDAVGTPPHLHFEIHPVQLLGLGYDGVVNPFPYLTAWRRLADVSLDVAPAEVGRAPPAAAVLLEAQDISTVSGLDEEALEEVLAMPALFGEGRLALGPGVPRPRVVGAPPGFPSASE